MGGLISIATFTSESSVYSLSFARIVPAQATSVGRARQRIVRGKRDLVDLLKLLRVSARRIREATADLEIPGSVRPIRSDFPEDVLRGLGLI